jgi:hypothetical protein
MNSLNTKSTRFYEAYEKEFMQAGRMKFGDREECHILIKTFNDITSKHNEYKLASGIYLPAFYHTHEIILKNLATLVLPKVDYL